MSKIKEKRISEWLEELPEPIRTKALDNFKKRGNRNVKVRTLRIAIFSAFIWTKTSEGNEYWISVSNSDYKVEPDLLSEEFVLLFDSFLDSNVYNAIRANEQLRKEFIFDKKQGWVLRTTIKK